MTPFSASASGTATASDVAATHFSAAPDFTKMPPNPFLAVAGDPTAAQDLVRLTFPQGRETVVLPSCAIRHQHMLAQILHP